jgi:hypothetical protein
MAVPVGRLKLQLELTRLLFVTQTKVLTFCRCPCGFLGHLMCLPVPVLVPLCWLCLTTATVRGEGRRSRPPLRSRRRAAGALQASRCRSRGVELAKTAELVLSATGILLPVSLSLSDFCSTRYEQGRTGADSQTLLRPARGEVVACALGILKVIVGLSEDTYLHHHLPLHDHNTTLSHTTNILFVLLSSLSSSLWQAAVLPEYI